MCGYVWREANYFPPDLGQARRSPGETCCSSLWGCKVLYAEDNQDWRRLRFSARSYLLRLHVEKTRACSPAPGAASLRLFCCLGKSRICTPPGTHGSGPASQRAPPPPGGPAPSRPHSSGRTCATPGRRRQEGRSGPAFGLRDVVLREPHGRRPEGQERASGGGTGRQGSGPRSGGRGGSCGRAARPGSPGAGPGRSCGGRHVVPALQLREDPVPAGAGT